MPEPTHFACIGRTGIYVEIARESLEYCLKCEMKVKSLEEEKLTSKTEDELALLDYRESLIRWEQGKHSIVTVVFSAMAVEAYIYDYAARNLSDSFVKKYLDKLDLVSKWVVIPLIVTGKEFPSITFDRTLTIA